jgi:hypothetical protein
LNHPAPSNCAARPNLPLGVDDAKPTTVPWLPALEASLTVPPVGKLDSSMCMRRTQSIRETGNAPPAPVEAVLDAAALDVAVLDVVVLDVAALDVAVVDDELDPAPPTPLLAMPPSAPPALVATGAPPSAIGSNSRMPKI